MSSRSRSPPPAAFHSPPPPPPHGRSRSRSPMDRSPRGASRSPRRGSSPPRRGSRSPPRSPRKDESSSVITTLYISGLHPKTRDVDLERKISKFGKIVNMKLVTDPRTRESRGFGFIGLETPEQATAVITNMNNTEIDGRKITVEKARRERSRSPTPGKYLGSDRLRRAINNSRPLPPPVYSSYPYRPGYGRPYPPMPYGGYPPYPPTRGYPDRYSPDRRRDRSPIRSPPRRYSPPPYRGRESPMRGGGRERERERAPFYSRDLHRDRSRSREREYR